MYRTAAMQVEGEIARFAEIVAVEGARSYLEIGSKHGGSLWRVAHSLQPGSTIVAVDLPKGTRLWHETEPSLKACIEELCRLGHDARVIWGSSVDAAVIAEVRRYAPFDVCLLDGNHTMPFIVRDVSVYGPMTRLLAFHDIAWHRQPEWVGTRIDVPIWWNEHKDEYARYEEIKLCPTRKNNGIGVLWR